MSTTITGEPCIVVQMLTTHDEAQATTKLSHVAKTERRPLNQNVVITRSLEAVMRTTLSQDKVTCNCWATFGIDVLTEFSPRHVLESLI